MNDEMVLARACVELDLQNAFDEALFRIWQTHQSKGHDYAVDADEWSNFRSTAQHFDLPIYEAADFFEITKLARLKALRSDGKLPKHESIKDTYLDKAVYAVLAFAMYLDHSHGAVASAQSVGIETQA